MAAVLVCGVLAALPAAAQSLPSPWVSADIGAPVPAGAASWSTPAFTVRGGGADIWGTRDQFRMVYRQVTGDVEVIARVDSISAGEGWAKAGVMIRASLSAGSPHAFALVSRAKGAAFQRRAAAGGLTTHAQGPSAAAPSWVRIVRIGSRLTGFSSPDGKVWTMIGGGPVALGTAAYVGLAVTSHTTAAAATAVMSQVSVRTLGVPSPWRAADIGSPAVPGTVSVSQGSYAIHAAGRDIWDTADQYHFVYQAVTGDVDVSLRVRSVARSHAWAKSGVMIRESLAPGSRHAFALLSAGRGYAFHRRVDPGGFTEAQAGVAGASPGWVRLVRTGSRIEAFRSADGAAWASLGFDIVPMGDTVYVGIATTAHNEGAAARALLDSLTLRPLSGTPVAGEPVPAAAIQAPRGITFQASADHALVTGYRLEIFTGSADPSTAAPVAASDLGRPAPDAAGDITVDRAAFFSALPPGTYLATVSSIGGGGSSRSAAVAFDLTP